MAPQENEGYVRLETTRCQLKSNDVAAHPKRFCLFDISQLKGTLVDSWTVDSLPAPSLLSGRLPKGGSGRCGTANPDCAGTDASRTAQWMRSSASRSTQASLVAPDIRQTYSATHARQSTTAPDCAKSVLNNSKRLYSTIL